MEVSEKNAKALLNRILARLRAEQPAYTYCNVGVHDVPTECELRLPTVSLDGNVLESRSFNGSGRNKKEATTNAAISAVKAFLEEDWVRGMFEEPTAPALADAVARTLTREARADSSLESLECYLCIKSRCHQPSGLHRCFGSRNVGHSCCQREHSLQLASPRRV